MASPHDRPPYLEALATLPPVGRGSGRTTPVRHGQPGRATGHTARRPPSLMEQVLIGRYHRLSVVVLAIVSAIVLITMLV